MKKQSKLEEKENCERLLRNAADDRLARSPTASPEIKEKNPEELLHELQVHQIELEMQNEELRKTQLALEESRQRYADLYDFAPVGYFTFTPEALIKEANLTAATLLGEARQKLVNRRFRGFIAPADFDLWDQHFLSVLREGERQTCDLTLKRQDGSTFQAGLESIRIEVSREAFEVHTTITDITERKRAQEALRASEEHYRILFEEALDGICIADAETGIIIDCNQAMAVLVGRERAELIGRSQKILHPPEDDQAVVSFAFKQHLTDKQGQILETQVVTRQGDIREVGIKANFLDIRGKKILQGIFRDITERKRTEETIRLSEERYRTVIEEIDEGYYEVDLAGNFTFVNDSMIRQLQYSREELIGMNYRTYIPQEEGEGVYKAFNRAYRTGEIIKWYPVTNIRKDRTLLFFEDSISCRRDKEGRVIGFRGISRDITERKRAEEKLNQTLENLRKAMGGIIQVVSSTVETRDPYTAGHQRRVADLARAIATEMNLTEDQREGLGMAGTIHDLGKVSIPAEILSKPTRLTEIEYKLIQNHSQTGYDILKDIDFPWPLAEIVFQHHERLNGSGYPRGLKAEDISLEARILMVADVVEAMASYRPYRPALGIETALEEIEKNKGVLYDPGVVEVCLKLFREKGFEFEE